MNNTVKILKLHKIKDSRKTTLRCRQMSRRHSVWPDQQTRPDNEYYTCLRLTRFQDDRFLLVPWVKHCCDTLIFCKKEYDTNHLLTSSLVQPARYLAIKRRNTFDTNWNSVVGISHGVFHSRLKPLTSKNLSSRAFCAFFGLISWNLTTRCLALVSAAD